MADLCTWGSGECGGRNQGERGEFLLYCLFFCVALGEGRILSHFRFHRRAMSGISLVVETRDIAHVPDGKHCWSAIVQLFNNGQPSMRVICWGKAQYA